MKSKYIAGFVIVVSTFVMNVAAMADDDNDSAVGSYCKELAEQLPEVFSRETCVICNNLAVDGTQEAVCICKELRDVGVLQQFAGNFGQCVKFLKGTAN